VQHLWLLSELLGFLLSAYPRSEVLVLRV